MEDTDKYLTVGALDGKNILDNVHKAKEMVKVCIRQLN